MNLSVLLKLNLNSFTEDFQSCYLAIQSALYIPLVRTSFGLVFMNWSRIPFDMYEKVRLDNFFLHLTNTHPLDAIHNTCNDIPASL